MIRTKTSYPGSAQASISTLVAYIQFPECSFVNYFNHHPRTEIPQLPFQATEVPSLEKDCYLLTPNRTGHC